MGYLREGGGGGVGGGGVGGGGVGRGGVGRGGVGGGGVLYSEILTKVLPGCWREVG